MSRPTKQTPQLLACLTMLICVVLMIAYSYTLAVERRYYQVVHEGSKYESIFNLPAMIQNRPILKFSVGNGLHNQLMSFVDGMVLALLFQEQYDVVLPTMYGSAFFKENRSQEMSFGDLYNSDYFIECLSSSSTTYQHSSLLRIHKSVPPLNFNYTTEKIVYTPEHDGRKVNDEHNWNSTKTALLEFASKHSGKVVVDIGRWYARYEYKFQDYKSFESRRRIIQCLRPAPDIEKVVTKAMQNIRRRYPHAHHVTAIHPRLEDDWRLHCSRHKSTMKDCWINEEEWVSRLQENNGLTHPSHLLAIGGVMIDKMMFAKSGFTVITKDDLLEPRDLSSFQYTSSLSAIDFFLALEADNFYGFMWSSMDIMIFESRFYNCRPSESIHFRLFDSSWLHDVSSWTNSFFFYRLDDAICQYKEHANSQQQCENVSPLISRSCDRHSKQLKQQRKKDKKKLKRDKKKATNDKDNSNN